MTIVRRYKHDNKGRRTEKTEARNGLESNIVEKYTYNDMNEIAEISTTDVTPQETPYSVIQHYAYPETDSVGNCTVREIKGQVPGYKDEIIQRWERTIEYYQ